MKTKTFSPELLHKIDAYWCTANYLSVGQIYLYDNSLLKQLLKLSHVKPQVVAVSTILAAKMGLFIHNHVSFEGVRKLQTIIFDKTGTHTEGRFGVTDTLVLSRDIGEEMLRQYTASVETSSEHPIAKSIVASSEKKLFVEGFNSITGKGIEGRIEGKDVKVVSLGYMHEQNIGMTDEPLQAHGKMVVFVLVDGKLKGAIALAGIVRPEVKQAIVARLPKKQ